MRLRGSTALPTPKPSRASRMPPTLAFDPGERRIVRVPLTQGRTATLDVDDFKVLEARGVPLTWFFNGNGRGLGYVRVTLPGPSGALAMVARLILRTPTNEIIRYVDGDPTNLCRSNLVTGKRSSPELEQRVRDALAEIAASQEWADAALAASVGGHWVPDEGPVRCLA